jgi:hypothetical protein
MRNELDGLGEVDSLSGLTSTEILGYLHAISNVRSAMIIKCTKTQTKYKNAFDAAIRKERDVRIAQDPEGYKQKHQTIIK